MSIVTDRLRLSDSVLIDLMGSHPANEGLVCQRTIRQYAMFPNVICNELCNDLGRFSNGVADVVVFTLGAILHGATVHVGLLKRVLVGGTIERRLCLSTTLRLGRAIVR